MLSGISVTCFASSYAVALCLELTRLVFRSGVRGAIMVGFAGAGLFAHTVFLYHRAVRASGPPLSSERDWYLLATWGLAAIYLYLTYYHRKTPVGLFVLPLVLGLLAWAALVADPQPFPRAPASQIWGIIHGVSVLLGTLAILIGFAAGLMYLRQTHRLKRKLAPQSGLRLPSLEWLERTNSRAIGIALGMFLVGIFSGMVLNLVRDTSRVPWYDPVVLSTLLMSGWLGVSVAGGVWYQPVRRGRKVALLTIVSFVFLALVLAAQLCPRTQHGGGKSAGH
jgi:ABC-type transport system involved in cytochrome c biogenesis permease subunit